MTSTLFILFFSFISCNSIVGMDTPANNHNEKFPIMSVPNEIKLEIITADLRSSKNDFEFKQNIKSLMQLRLLNKFFNSLITDHGKDFIDKTINLLEKNNNAIRVAIEDFISKPLFNTQWNIDNPIRKIKFFINSYISNKNLKELAYWSWVKDSLELGELYLKYGGAVNYIHPDGEHILVKCFHRNSPKFAELLLTHGANPNCREQKGLQCSILRYALQTQRINFIQLLLTYNANIHDIGGGVTALDFAVKKKNPEIIKLIQAKIDEQKRSNHEQ